MNNWHDLFGTQRAPQTTAYIEVTLRNGATTRHKLEKIETSIGRDGSKNDICVNENVVSAQHLLIRHDNSSDSYTLVHPHPARLPGGTTNGLIFKRRRVPGKEEFKHDLGHGDSFSINNEVMFRFIVEQPAAQGPRPQATAFDLNKDEMTIGRTSANDIQLDHPQVSARHAVLRKSGSGHLLIDRNSTNHTYVNGRSITRTLLKR
ncbi:MAG TPA: FHA domain-containing protein, partial [Ktedonobacteraceae bacterium]|nr:FHA domain-containing protein [Ktedonobacteraceae bacterium]